MSYNGSGTFNVNTAGQPVVTGTVISSTAFNALTADLATGLSTAITKDGQTTTTARITFAQGISSTLTTDATSSTTGSIITAGGISCQKALNVGTTTTLGGALTYGGVTLSNAVTGTGNMVLSASPTLTGTLTAATISASATATATAFIPSGSSAPTNGVYLPAANSLGFSTNSNERMRLDASGNLLINTTTATSILSIASSSSLIGYYNSTAANGVYSIWANSGTQDGVIGSAKGLFGGTLSDFGVRSENNLIFGIGSSEKARIATDGSFLVGTTSAGGWNGNFAAEVKASGFALSAYSSGSSGNSALILRVDSSTNNFGNFYFNGAVNIGSITVTGGGTGTAFNTTSDYRLKKNIRPMTGGLALVSSLRPVNYQWEANDFDGEGFIAHELQDLIPLAVAGVKDDVNADGSIKAQGVDLSKVVPHLVCALQELNAKFDAYVASHS